MRVCHLSGTHVGSHYFRDLALGLNDRGVQSLWVTLPEADAPPWLEPSGAIRYASLGTSSRRHYPAAVVRLARMLRAHRVDILQTHLFDAAIVGIIAGRLARVPLVIVTRHHLDHHHLLKRPVHVELDRVTARLADRVIVPARAVREHMVSVERVSAAKIEVIHHGLNLQEFGPDPAAGARIREEFGLAGAFVVGYVGWLEPTKGLYGVLDAASALRARIANLRVLVLGDHPDAGLREAVLEEIQRRGLMREVILAGHRSDVAACMQAMDVLAHPSRSEALPQVLIEAMAVGTPVVASAVGGVDEIVAADQTGTLIPPADSEALTGAIERLYRDRKLRERYSQAGVLRARSCFDAPRMVQQHYDCYARWLVGRRALSGQGSSR